MSNILVVVDETEATEHVMGAAVERAERTGATLVAVHAMPRRLYERRQRQTTGTHDLRHEGYTYTASQARAEATGVAERIARAAIGERDVPYTAVGVIGTPTQAVLAAAGVHDCEAVLLPERKPKWFGPFGSFDRTLAKRFDGPVVRVPRPSPGRFGTAKPLLEA